MTEKRFEDNINELLSGNTQKNALDFITYLRANEIEPQGSSSCEVFYYKDMPVCVIFVNGSEQMPGPYTVWHSGHDGKYAPEAIPAGEDADTVGLTDTSADEQVKEAAWAHINICSSCGCGRQPGRRTAVFGREFDNVCTSTLAFTDPDPEALENLKQLALLMRDGIDKYRSR